MADITRYLHVFQTKAQRDDAYQWGKPTYSQPWVSYTEQTDSTDYNMNNHPLINDYTNPTMMTRLREKGVIGQDVTELWKEDMDAITTVPGGQVNSNPSGLFVAYDGSLEDFKYFTGLTTTPNYFAYRGGKSVYVTDIKLPPNLTSVGTYFLHDQQFLRGNLIYPEGLTTVGQYSTSQCYRLRKITYSSTVTSIASGAFSRTGWAGSEAFSYGETWYDTDHCGICIICKATTPPTVAASNNSIFTYGSYNFTSFMTAHTAIFVPDESVSQYKSASWWSTYADYIYPMSTMNDNDPYPEVS